MKGRRQPTSPDNHSVAVVPVYTPDPHGAAMFAGIVNGNLGHLGSRPAMDTRGRAFHGWVANPQAPMTGLANIAGGRVVVNPVTRLDQAHGVTPDAVQQLFTQRAAEGRYS